MSLSADLLRLLQTHGIRTSETIRDALEEFVEVVQEESDGFSDGWGEEEDEEFDEVEEA